MRRVVSVAGVLGLCAGVTLSVGAAHADQEQCVNDLPFAAKACVKTTNSGGSGGDEHQVSVSGYEEVPTFGMGFNIYVTCDDNGGTSDAQVSGNVGTEMPITLPIACPELP